MQKNKRNRVAEPTQPIQREVIKQKIEVNIIAERCPQCGKLYGSLKNQSLKDSNGESLQYGSCPNCATKLCKHIASDRVRVVK